VDSLRRRLETGLLTIQSPFGQVSTESRFLNREKDESRILDRTQDSRFRIKKTQDSLGRRLGPVS
jgi:hypothetical protein